jgi:cardiolipin synthase A/B
MKWKLYHDTNEAIFAMEDACRRAERSIDIEMFIFGLDLARGPFGDLLVDKARMGVKVRLLLDMVGSFDFIGSKEEKRLLDSGVEVTVWNPIRPSRLHNFTSWYFRNHRKIVVVDGKIAFTGGVNLKRAPAERRDTQVEFEGPIAREAQAAFERMLSNAKGHNWNPFPAAPAIEGFRFLTHSPHRRARHLLRECIKAITKAKKSVCIITPYFVPSLRFTRHVRAAARRGVDVRILLPSLSDHTLADLAARSYIGLMLSAGIKIYIYRPKFLHAKVVTVDDDWSMVGSLNIDNLSFLYNYEAGLVSTNRSFNLELREQFATDLTRSSEITKHEWHKRPLLDKVLEVLSWPIHFMV